MFIRGSLPNPLFTLALNIPTFSLLIESCLVSRTGGELISADICFSFSNNLLISLNSFSRGSFSNSLNIPSYRLSFTMFLCSVFGTSCLFKRSSSTSRGTCTFDAPLDGGHGSDGLLLGPVVSILMPEDSTNSRIPRLITIMYKYFF